MTDRRSEETVRLLLAAAGLAPDDEDVRTLARGYADLRAAVDALHALPLAPDGDEPQPVTRPDA